MSHKEYVVRHPLDLDDDRSEAVDDIKVAFTTRSRVSIVKLVLPSQLILVLVLCLDLFICQPLHRACIQLVQHTHLLDVEVFFIKILRSLDASFEHRSPHAKAFRATIAISRGILWIRRRGIAWTRREVSRHGFEMLPSIPRITLVLDEFCQGLPIMPPYFTKIRVASNFTVDIVHGLSMPRDPDLSG